MLPTPPHSLQKRENETAHTGSHQALTTPPPTPTSTPNPPPGPGVRILFSLCPHSSFSTSQTNFYSFILPWTQADVRLYPDSPTCCATFEKPQNHAEPVSASLNWKP